MAKRILSSNFDVVNISLNGGIYRYAKYSGNTVIIGGDFTTVNGNTQNHLCRFYEDGRLDVGFNANLGSGFNNRIRMIHVEPSGKIVVSGDFTSFNGNTRNYIVRLNSDGTEDTAFYNTVGKFNNGLFRIIHTTDGGFLYGGMFTSWNGVTHNRLIKFNSDYSLNTTFNNNIGSAYNNHIVDMITDSLGKYIIVGNFTNFKGNTRYQLNRLNTDGTEDTTFYTNANPSHANKGGLFLCSDNKVLVTVWYNTSDGGLFKLNTDGTRDTTFANNWKGIGDSMILNINRLPNDKLVIVGGFTKYNSLVRNRILSIDENGTEDTSFYNSITSWGDGTAFDYYLYMAYVTSDSKNLITGGYHTGINGVAYNRINKLTVAGLNDPFAHTIKSILGNKNSSNKFRTINTL